MKLTQFDKLAFEVFEQFSTEELKTIHKALLDEKEQEDNKRNSNEIGITAALLGLVLYIITSGILKLPFAFAATTALLPLISVGLFSIHKIFKNKSLTNKQ